VLAYFVETAEGFEPDIYREALARAQEIAEKRREAGRKGGQISGAKRQAFASKTSSKGQARRAQADTVTVTVKTTSPLAYGAPGAVGAPDGEQAVSELKAVRGGAA
jgi:general stress protein YciG